MQTNDMLNLIAWNLIVCKQMTEPLNFADLCLTELFEIEQLDHSTMLKKWLMFNWIASAK